MHMQILSFEKIDDLHLFTRSMGVAPSGVAHVQLLTMVHGRLDYCVHAKFRRWVVQIQIYRIQCRGYESEEVSNGGWLYLAQLINIHHMIAFRWGIIMAIQKRAIVKQWTKL